MNQSSLASRFLVTPFFYASLGSLTLACAATQPEPTTSVAATPPPQTQEKEVRFVPGPSPDEIRAAVTLRDSDLRQCYLAGTFKNAQLRGTVNVTFTIDTEGRVSETIDSGSDLPDAEVVSCVLNVFASLEFPAGASSETEVTYPINFGQHS